MVIFIYQLVNNSYKPEILDQKKHNFESQAKRQYVIGAFSRAQLLFIMKLDKGKNIFVHTSPKHHTQHLLGLFHAYAASLHIHVYFKSSSLMATYPKEVFLVSTVLSSFCQCLSLWSVYSSTLKVSRSQRIGIFFLPTSPTAVSQFRYLGI